MTLATFYSRTMKRSRVSKGGAGLSLAVFFSFLSFFSKPNDVFQITLRKLERFLFQEILYNVLKQSSAFESG